MKSIVQKFQLLSDLHLENQSSLPLVTPTAPYLVLAGNIGNPTSPTYYKFLTSVSSKFETVFLVLGLTEYEVLTLDSVKGFILNQLKTFRLDNVHVLDNGYFDLTIDDVPVRIIGSTFWPFIQRPCPVRLGSVRVKTKTAYTNFSNVVNNEHERCFWYLAHFIAMAKDDGRKVIIITHFIPDFSLVAPHIDRSLIEYVASNDAFVMFDLPVIAWLYGHTDEHFTKNINNVLFMTRPHASIHRLLRLNSEDELDEEIASLEHPI